jgi:hypothetical protein
VSESTAPTGTGSTASTSPSTPAGTAPGDVDAATDPEPPADTPPAVVVTSAAWNAGSGAVEVSSYLTSVEDDGHCTLELSSGSQVVTVDSTAYPDASTTACDLLIVDGADLSPGTWAATVTYSSARTTAHSPSQTIEVP